MNKENKQKPLSFVTLTLEWEETDRKHRQHVRCFQAVSGLYMPTVHPAPSTGWGKGWGTVDWNSEVGSSSWSRNVT